MVLKSIELNSTPKTNHNVMSRRKSVTHFVAVNDLEQPPSEQEGLLIEVPKKGGDIPSNREQALQIVLKKWEKGEIEADLFPNGLSESNIFYVPPDSPRLQKSEAQKESHPIAPIVERAQEIIHLTKLQLEVQQERRKKVASLLYQSMQTFEENKFEELLANKQLSGYLKNQSDLESPLNCCNRSGN